MFTHATYLSVFTHRYGAPEMKNLFAEITTRKLWRTIWVALASIQHTYHLVSKQELADLKKHAEDIDLETALKIEKEIHHDIMAEIRTYASQCKIGGGKIHLGATSMDIRDNADVLQQKKALELLKKQLQTTLQLFSTLITTYQKTVCMGFTHIQPAEPTTLGYRFANWAQDFLLDYEKIVECQKSIKSKGIKGAVGTSASYQGLLQDKHVSPSLFEKKVMKKLGLVPFDVATQVYPRKQDFNIINTLAGIGQSAFKFALDLRLMQSPLFGELSEPFGKKQVGSSAMPFKRNPIMSERICSLARLLPAYAQVAWQNASQTILERTLDDSANRRIIIPESFLVTSEILQLLNKRILPAVAVNNTAIERNLNTFGIFAGTEPLLMKLAEEGMSRQQGHEIIRELTQVAWQEIQQGKVNPLLNLLTQHSIIKKYFSPSQIKKITNASIHIGDAIQRCQHMVRKIKKSCSL